MTRTPDFGPGGYLPERAAKRARKIVLREQMGMGWPLAAAFAALVVAAAGIWYVVWASRPPAPPFTPVTTIEQVPAGGAEAFEGPAGRPPVLVLRAGGPVRAFADADGVRWCAQSRRLETGGAVWTPDGRLVGGVGDSLQPLRSTVFDGTVYVDAVTVLPRPAPDPRDETPACG